MDDTPAIDYEALRNEADRLEASLKRELLRYAVVHAEEAQRSMEEVNQLPRDQQVHDKKVRKQVKAASKAFRHLQELLRR